jgi:hypothetical protein
MDFRFAGAMAVALLFGFIAGAALKKIAQLAIRFGGVHWARPVSSGSGTIGDLSLRHWTRPAQSSRFGRIVLTGGGAHFGEHRLQRFVTDIDGNYFGYDLLFSAENLGTYRLAFEPLSLQPDQLLPVRLGIQTRRPERLPLEQLPPSQIVRLGRALEFNLATADGKHKVIERIKLGKC